MKTLLLVCGFAGLLMADAGDLVSGPVLGLAASEGNQYRVLHGAPGSMELGETVVLPEGATKANLAPRHQWLLVERNGALESFDWQRKESHKLNLAHADQIAFSPSGQELALYYSETNRLVVMTGLPGRPVALRDEKRGDLFEGVLKLGVSDGGEWVVAHTAQGRLLRLDNGAAEELHRSDDISSFAFIPGKQALLVGDRIQNAALMVDAPAGGVRTQVLLSAEQGLDDPDGVWAGSSNRLAVGSYKRGQVWILDGSDWRIENVDGLAGMDEVQLRDTLLLSTQAGGAVSLLSWANSEQRIYLLPRREE